MSLLAVITARGGSKRIPKKNIKDFFGKPMLAYAIQAAQQSNLFDEIMVSTDDEEIAETARKFGAVVPFMRSEKTSDDYAIIYDVLDEVITEYKKRGKVFDTLCCIFPCVPFLTGEILRDAYSKLGDNDAVLPVCKFPVPIEWALKIENGIVSVLDRKACDIRSQDLEDRYFDAGMFYICRTEKIYEHKSLCPDKTAPYIIDAKLCEDIDTIEDWEEAEEKYQVYLNRINK